MIRIDVRGMAEVQAALRNLAAEQLPFAMKEGINTVAFKTKDALQNEMRAVFDRPTPWLIRQVAVAKATKTNLTAIVGTPEGIKDASGAGAGFSRTTSSGVFERILIPHIDGGQRQQRNSEKRLVRAGIMKSDEIMVPGAGMPLDSYGNPRTDELLMILSWLNTLQWSSQGATQNRAERIRRRMNATERRGESYFAIPSPRGARPAPGIYKKMPGGKVLPMYLFVNPHNYKKRLDWYGVVDRTVAREFPPAMSAAVQKAMETAR
jgi:hypothetical protein